MVQVLIRQPPVYSMSGQTKSRPSIPHGAYAPNYRRGVKSERAARRDAQVNAFNALSPEEQSKRMHAQRDYADDMAIWRREFDDPTIGPDEASRRLKHRRDQRRILEGFVDQDARVAVEGDTDLNHDNLEG